ncbi:MAG: hypothetical protein LUH14_09500 [Clostridiaceae bacterium]|nr:hypothetical protein [Clostridiaceae bacterium]
MEKEERWNQFAASGKVMDYLEYRESLKESTYQTFSAGSRRGEEREKETASGWQYSNDRAW